MLRELIRIMGGKLKHLGYAPQEGLSAVSPLAFSDFSGVAPPPRKEMLHAGSLQRLVLVSEEV